MIDAIDRVKNSQLFKEWIAKHPNSHLSHVFTMIDKNTVERQYDVGYYNKETDLITTFVSNNKIEIRHEEQTFRHPDHSVFMLEVNRVKIHLSKALEIAHNLQQKKYKNELPLKKIVVLQNLPIGQVYNITYVTQNFKTLNIKIDSEDGKVVKDKLVKIFGFGK